MGETATSVDGAGNTTTYSYDLAGRLIGTTLPDSTRNLVAYDDAGQPISQSDLDAAGTVLRTKSATYDAMGNVLTRRDARGNTSTFTYDAVGVLTGEVQPVASGTSITTSFGHDAAGNRTRFTDGRGYTWLTNYTSRGQIESQVEPDGTVAPPPPPPPPAPAVTFVGSSSSTTVATTSVVGSKPSGVAADDVLIASLSIDNTATVTAPAGWTRLASMPQSPGGVLVDVYYRVATAGEPSTYTWTLNTAQKAGIGITAYRGVNTSSPFNTGVVTATASGASSISVSGVTTTVANAMVIGGLGQDTRNSTVTPPSGFTQVFVTSAEGQVDEQAYKVQASAGATGTLTWAVSNPVGVAAWATALAPATPPAATTPPATPSGPPTTPASSRTFGAGYDANGRLVSVSLPGGVSVANTYDAMGQLTGSTGSGAEAATTARTFGYDAVGRMTSASAPGGTDGFGYDDRGLLTSTTGPSGASSFAYTADGQMSSRVDAAGTTSYTYDSAGRLSTVVDPLSASTATYAYNSVNLPTSIGFGAGKNTRSFGYDSLHRLTNDTLRTSGGSTIASVAYGYDVNDNTISKTTTGVSGATGTRTRTTSRTA